jgi:hypothetical protein
MPAYGQHLNDVNKDLFEKVMRLTEQISSQENHFNDLESNYRKLTSTWLLASLGACGYVLTAHLDVDKWAIIAAIGASASLGIGVLWILDLDVYHRLLNCYFMQGLWLESQYSDWLYPVRIEMILSQETKDVSAKVRYYYIISVSLLLVITVFAVWNIKIPSYSLFIKCMATGLVAVLTLVIFWVHAIRGKKRQKAFMNSKIGKIIKDHETGTQL